MTGEVGRNLTYAAPLQHKESEKLKNEGICTCVHVKMYVIRNATIAYAVNCTSMHVRACMHNSSPSAQPSCQ